MVQFLDTLYWGYSSSAELCRFIIMPYESGLSVRSHAKWWKTRIHIGGRNSGWNLKKGSERWACDYPHHKNLSIHQPNAEWWSRSCCEVEFTLGRTITGCGEGRPRPTAGPEPELNFYRCVWMSVWRKKNLFRIQNHNAAIQDKWNDADNCAAPHPRTTKLVAVDSKIKSTWIIKTVYECK